MTWNPAGYLRFADERTRPAVDLAARVEVAAPARVVDLGCGPGNSTRVVRSRWPAAVVTGLDSSAEMLAAARADQPDASWELADLAAWSPPEPVEVAFSNAALQWVPDHAAVFPRLFAGVSAALAVQVPAHFASPVHRLMVDVSNRHPWRDTLAAARNTISVGRPGFYYDLLRPLARRIDLWETEYVHQLDGPDAILAWVRTTALRPYLDALPPGDRPAFERQFLAELTAAYPRQADGRVLFPFRRLFVVAYR
jgi:trans-aconitate 2-methyltransferase